MVMGNQEFLEGAGQDVLFYCSLSQREQMPFQGLWSYDSVQFHRLSTTSLNVNEEADTGAV